MTEILSVENMRKSDAKTIAEKTSGRDLMFRAGEAIFRAVSWKAPVVIVCGTGNNAGDGYVLAWLMKQAGIPCSLLLLEEKFSPDGDYYFRLAREAGVEYRLWADAREAQPFRSVGTVVDCIFGTGFHGDVAGAAREVILAVNDSSAYVVSVDINSGLNGDSGTGDCCVLSDLTVSVGSFQPGHFLARAKDVMKAKINCPIGIDPADPPYELLEEADLRPFFSPRPNDSNKGSYGYLALIGGSRRYTGAIRLADQAAAGMRAGAGVIKAAFPESLYPVIVPSLLESTAFPLPDRDGEILFSGEALRELTRNTRAAAFGMGVGTSDGAGETLRWLLSHYPGRLIIDADGLTLFSRLFPRPASGEGALSSSIPSFPGDASDPEAQGDRRFAPSSVILTPHLKEFSRLTGRSLQEIQASPIPLAKAYAAETGVILLLKGPTTIITDGRRVILTDAGCPGMATAGSGDVLSGILAALAGWMDSPLLAAAAAAFINGRAGEAAQAETNSISMIAGDTVAAIPRIISRLMA